MSLEAAILASSMSPPQYWEKYPNMIDVETTAFSVSTTYNQYTTVLSVSGVPGYVDMVALDPQSYTNLRITVDGIVTTLINTNSGSYSLGFIHNKYIHLYSGQWFWRPPLNGSVANSLGGNSFLVPFSTLWGTTDANAHTAIISQPIGFKQSLLVEAAVNSSSKYTVSVTVRGGHA